MSGVFAVLLVGLFAVAAGEVSWLEYLQLPKHDGLQRVCQLTETGLPELASFLMVNEVKIVVVENASAADNPCVASNFPEVIAQLLEPEQVRVCTLKIRNPLLLTGASLIKGIGIHIFAHGMVHRYEGKREVVPFISFLKKVRQAEVHTITGKLDKLAFDAVQRPRVVGFFVNGTVDHQAFLDAAKIFTPADIPFYVVYDRMVAKFLKLDIVGQINIHKVWQKTPVSCNVNPASVADIAVFVNRHRGTGFYHLTQDNLEQSKMDLSLLDETVPVVLAIGDQSTTSGAYFHRLLSKVVRNSTKLQYDELKVVWIDPEEFPVIKLAGNNFTKTFAVPQELPAMGFVNFVANTHDWFNAQTLNMTGDKLADDQNKRLVKLWFQTIINNTLNAGAGASTEHFIRAPQGQAVQNGASFDLDCIARDVVGDCLWYRDGKPIGYNMDRFPHYSWAGDVTKGDCSLKVIGAKEGRDDGQWHCEITGDETHPTVTSPVVTVTVEPIITIDTASVKSTVKSAKKGAKTEL